MSNGVEKAKEQSKKINWAAYSSLLEEIDPDQAQHLRVYLEQLKEIGVFDA